MIMDLADDLEPFLIAIALLLIALALLLSSLHKRRTWTPVYGYVYNTDDLGSNEGGHLHKTWIAYQVPSGEWLHWSGYSKRHPGNWVTLYYHPRRPHRAHLGKGGSVAFSVGFLILAALCLSAFPVM